jgi:hypothetical protein
MYTYMTGHRMCKKMCTYNMHLMYIKFVILNVHFMYFLCTCICICLVSKLPKLNKTSLSKNNLFVISHD